MGKRLKVFSLVSGLVVLIAAFMLAGCSANSPLAPEPDQIGSIEKLVGAGSYGSDAMGTTRSDKLISCEQGGTINIERGDYQHKFIVEPGAIDDDTQITVSVNREIVKSKDAIVFDFSPNGLVFREAAKLDFEMAELSSVSTSAKLSYYEPRLGIWVNQDLKPVVNGRVVFDIFHFSKYAISD